MATERLFAISAAKKIVLCRNRKCKKYGKKLQFYDNFSRLDLYLKS